MTPAWHHSEPEITVTLAFCVHSKAFFKSFFISRWICLRFLGALQSKDDISSNSRPDIRHLKREDKHRFIGKSWPITDPIGNVWFTSSLVFHSSRRKAFHSPPPPPPFAQFFENHSWTRSRIRWSQTKRLTGSLGKYHRAIKGDLSKRRRHKLDISSEKNGKKIVDRSNQVPGRLTSFIHFWLWYWGWKWNEGRATEEIISRICDRTLL